MVLPSLEVARYLSCIVAVVSRSIYLTSADVTTIYSEQVSKNIQKVSNGAKPRLYSVHPITSLGEMITELATKLNHEMHFGPHRTPSWHSKPNTLCLTHAWTHQPRYKILGRTAQFLFLALGKSIRDWSLCLQKLI